MSTVRMGIRSLTEGVRAMNLQSKLMEKQLDSLQEKFEASATRVEEKLEAMLTIMEVMLFSVQQPSSHQSQQSISQSKKTLDFNSKVEPPKTTTAAAAPLSVSDRRDLAASPIDRLQKSVSASHFGFLKENGSSASSSLGLDLGQYLVPPPASSGSAVLYAASLTESPRSMVQTSISKDKGSNPSHDLPVSGMAESKSVGTFSPMQNQEGEGEVKMVIVEPMVRVIVEGDINIQEINKLFQLHSVKTSWAILSCAQSLKTKSQSRCSKGKGTYLQLKEFLNVSSLIACENATKKFLLLWFRWWEEYRGGMKIVKEIVGATVRNFLREFVVTSFSTLDLELDFYGSMKLINYVRSQVAKKKCWSCGLAFECSEDLLEHLHAPATFDGLELLWEDDAYLKPFMVDDALLHSFADNDEDDENYTQTISKEEVMRELMNVGSVAEIGDDCSKVEEKEETVENMTQKFEKVMSNGAVKKETNGGQHEKQKDLKVSFANVAAREIKNVNDNYFGAYGSFSIHREMISDKVRTGAYRDAIVSNPSLLKQSTVVDVGSGMGILSLFAAQAGASRVIAVEASAKMASVATQIAKDNGLLSEKSENEEEKWCSGVINVVQTMIEDLGNCIQIQPHSVDIIVSEWMGYCLLYASKLLQHTTTVYLHHAIAEYAEALASKMTGNLKVVYFVNSGTEANELATLMARLYTGNLSMIALRNSHHGGSAGTLGLTGLHTWKYPIPQGEVLHVMNPNLHRGAFGSDATCYAKEVEDHIAFGSSGQVAGFIAETFQGAGAACHVPDAFGEQMMKNLESRGCPLLGIHATTGMILSLRESLQSCKDNLTACQAELEAAQSEIRKWYSAFQSGPVSPAGTNPEPALVITDL